MGPVLLSFLLFIFVIILVWLDSLSLFPVCLSLFSSSYALSLLFLLIPPMNYGMAIHAEISGLIVIHVRIFPHKKKFSFHHKQSQKRYMVSGSPCLFISFINVSYFVSFVVRGQQPRRGQ